jgi:SEL1 protein
MILVALCVMVSVLLYVRTRLVERLRREPAGGNGDGQQQGQGQPQPTPAAQSTPQPARKAHH